MAGEGEASGTSTLEAGKNQGAQERKTTDRQRVLTRVRERSRDFGKNIRARLTTSPSAKHVLEVLVKLNPTDKGTESQSAAQNNTAIRDEKISPPEVQN